MKRSHCRLIGLFLGIALMLSLGSLMFGQTKSAEKQQRIDGMIAVISKDTSTITIQSKNVRLQVLYNAKTQFSFRNKPATLDELKEGRRAICLVTSNEKSQMVATRIDLREK